MIQANITMSSDAHVYCRFQDSSNNQLSKGGVYYYQGTAATNASGSISVTGSGNFMEVQVWTKSNYSSF